MRGVRALMQPGSSITGALEEVEAITQSASAESLDAV